MFPEVDFDFEAEDKKETAAISTKIGRTPLFDFTTGSYVIRDGKIVECSQEEAVRQWIGFLVKTAAEKYPVYDGTDFGTYMENYIGYKDIGFVSSEIKREVEEKAMENRAIKSIENLEAEKDGSKLKVSLTVILQNEEEVEVETDV